MFYGRTKHIDIQHHFVREKVQAGEVCLEYVPTEQQIADDLAKPLPKDRFEAFRRALGIEEIRCLNWTGGGTFPFRKERIALRRYFMFEGFLFLCISTFNVRSTWITYRGH